MVKMKKKIKEWWKKQKGWIKWGVIATVFVFGTFILLKLLISVSKFDLLPSVIEIPIELLFFLIDSIMTYLLLPLIVIFQFLLDENGIEYIIVNSSMEGIGGEGTLPTALGITLLTIMWFFMGVFTQFIIKKLKK